MKSVSIKSGTKMEGLCIFLMRKGGVYYGDLTSFAYRLFNTRQDGNEATGKKGSASRLIGESIKRGYVSVVEMRLKSKRFNKTEDTDTAEVSSDEKTSKPKHEAYYKKGKMVRLCHLTESGLDEAYRLYLKRVGSGTPFPRKYFEKLRKPYTTDVAALSNTAYHSLTRMADLNHLETMFNCIGIPSDVQSKPSLETVYIYRSGGDIKPSKYTGYKLYWQNADLERDLEKGFFYTSAEIISFMEDYAGGRERYSSVCRGIYISNARTLVIYSNGKGNNNMIYCPQQSSETSLISLIRNQGFATRADILMPPSLEFLRQSGSGVSALAIAESNSFIVSTAAGRRGGRKTKGHKSDVYMKKLLVPSSVVFTGDQYDSYDYFYCVAGERRGIEDLKSLIETTPLEIINFYRRLLSDKKRFQVNHGDIYFPVSCMYKDEWKECCYIPNYELTLLTHIRDCKSNPIIITHEDMVDDIQHITHKKHIFIDADTLKIMSGNSALIIDSNGYPKGRKMIKDFLASKGLCADKRQLDTLPEKFNQESKAFFNAVAEGRISMDTIEAQLMTSELKPRQYRKSRQKMVRIPQDLYDIAKQEAEQRQVTLYHVISSYLKKAMKSKANEV